MLDDRELLARLIEFDSVSANAAAPIADFAAGYLSDAGCGVWRQAYDAGRKVNILAWREPARPPADPHAGLLLSGHVDVVPAGEPDWASDPFRLVERDGRFFGRGVADMKGWVALAMNRLARRSPETLHAPLGLLLTADEEIGSVGAQRFVSTCNGLCFREAAGGPAMGGRGELPRACLVGEPTGLRVVRMHKGHLKGRVAATGRPAHSGYPHLGVNAIEIAGRALTRLVELSSQFRSERTDTSRYFPECPYPVLGVGMIRGGSAVNVVPANCEIDFGMRLLPGQQTDAICARIDHAINGIAVEAPGGLRWEVLNDSPPMLCREEAAIYRELCALVGQRETVSASYASDAGWLSTIGLECVLCGPGSIEDAHRANESIDIGQWREGGRVLDEIIDRVCLGRRDV